MSKLFAGYCTTFFRWVLCFFASVVTSFSLVFTVTTDFAETGFFVSFNQGILVFALAVSLTLLLLFLLARLEKAPRVPLFLFLFLLAFAVSLTWTISARAVPDFDSYDLIGASRMDSESGWWAKGGYMERYPFQVPFTLLLAVLRIFWPSDSSLNAAFQVINCLAVSACVVLLSLIAESLAPNDPGKVRVACTFLVLLFPPIYLYVTFVYGNMIALPFAFSAFYFQILGFRQHRFSFQLLAGFSAVISILLKSSMLLVAVALCVVWVVAAIKHLRFAYVIAAIITVVLYAVSSSFIISAVESRLGTDLHNGLPQVSWIVMGTGADAARGREFSTAKPGWYSGYTWAMPAEEYDSKEVSQDAMKLLNTRAHTFIENPGFAARFFVKKFAYEWAEPTYESIVMSNWSIAGPSGTPMSERELGDVAQSMYYGALGEGIGLLCDVIQLLIYASAAYCFFEYRKTMPVEVMAASLCAAGGGLFYLFWEAKAQYTLPFVLLLIPYAAVGLVALKNRLAKQGL